MAVIYFTDEDLKNLELISNMGREGEISIYNMPSGNGSKTKYEPLRDMVIKSYKDDSVVKEALNKKQYTKYIENKHKKVLAYSKYNPNDFKFLNIPQGPIYLNEEFYASYQRYINPNVSLTMKCFNIHSKDFNNLDLIIHFAKQIQSGIKDELHPLNSYTDDLHLCNILVDEDNNIHFIDMDGFRIGKYAESSYYFSDFESSDPTYRSLILNNSKYLEDGILRSSKQKDIFHIYEYFIQLVTKASIDKLLPNHIYKLLEGANFPYEFIDMFSLCFDNNVSNEFIPLDLFNKIQTDYTIDDYSYLLCRSSYCKLKRK